MTPLAKGRSPLAGMDSIYNKSIMFEKIKKLRYFLRAIKVKSIEFYRGK